jgi:predicted porin
LVSERRFRVRGRSKRPDTGNEILASQHFGDYEMRKTQMALAAVALVASSAALAEVKVSGSVDTGVGSFNSAAAPGTNKIGFQEGATIGGSFLTVAGSDDVGGGMKASFTLQTGFDAGTGAVSNGGAVTGNTVFNRQSNIALSGGFGTVTLGAQVSSYIVGATGTVLPGSIFGAFDVAAIATQDAAAGGGNTGGFFTRNAVTYTTPDLGGASLSVQKQVQGNDPASFDGTAAAGSMSLGDVKASFGYLDRTDRKSWTIGASAPLGPLTANLRYTESDPTGTVKASTQVRGGVSYALTDATTLTLQHATNSGSLKGDLTSIGAIYSLSKATNLYAHYSGASAGWSQSAYGSAAASATKGGSSFAVGIATNF